MEGEDVTPSYMSPLRFTPSGALRVNLSQWSYRLLFFALLFTFLVECGSAVVCRLLSNSAQARRFLWNPDIEQARENWREHSSALDKYVGGFFAKGAKSNTEFPEETRPCASAYGDSYVGGADVPNQDGWIEQLSRKLGCRINNYAVGGDGTDQAYMRFRQLHDDSSLVLLGIDTHTILNVINQYDGFLSGQHEPFDLKGRFVVDADGKLQWVALPALDEDGFVKMLVQPKSVLPRSYFLPDTPDGPVTFCFPYTLTLIRIGLIPRVQNVLMRRAEWRGLYQADHPSSALQLMVSICEAFVEFAKAQGKRTLIVMLPVAGSFREQANHGSFEYLPLVALLRAKGLEVVDPGAAMLAKLGRAPICDYFGRSHSEFSLLSAPVLCGGHYSVLANTVLAQLVYDEFRNLKLLEPQIGGK
jgi:hypothetical protein